MNPAEAAPRAARLQRQFSLLPFNLPRLSDKQAAQLLEVIHQFVEGITHHYADQAYRYKKRWREIEYNRQSGPSDSDDQPF